MSTTGASLRTVTVSCIVAICSVAMDDGSGEVVHYYPGVVCTAAEAADECGRRYSGRLTTIAGMATCSAGTESSSVSCDYGSYSEVCTEVVGTLEPERITAFTGMCEDQGGWMIGGGASCPATGRLGTCEVQVSSTITSETRFYQGGSISPLTLAAMCAGNGGTWIADVQ